MNLKRTCRTCIHLCPSTYDVDEWDYEEERFKSISVPRNCHCEDSWQDLDEITDRKEYKPINIDCICYVTEDIIEQLKKETVLEINDCIKKLRKS